jgi:hypothetical protein
MNTVYSVYNLPIFQSLLDLSLVQSNTYNVVSNVMRNFVFQAYRYYH